ncbi:MAG TPA: DUF5937 family protein, partial [Streptosporangiaceae bacterium]
MIRLRLPAGVTNWVAIVYSPVVEAIFSLHVLTQPRHHPLQHDWVRSCRQLPPELRRRIGEFAWAFDGYVPVLASPAGRYWSFEDELESLTALGEGQMRAELLRPFALEFPRTPEVLDHRGVRDLILQRATARGPGAVRLARSALEDPHAIWQQLAEVL